MCQRLLAFMEQHGFQQIDDFRGHSLRYFTTHAELVRLQHESRALEKARQENIVTADDQWSSDDFVEQSARLARG